MAVKDGSSLSGPTTENKRSIRKVRWEHEWPSCITSSVAETLLSYDVSNAYAIEGHLPRYAKRHLMRYRGIKVDGCRMMFLRKDVVAEVLYFLEELTYNPKVEDEETTIHRLGPLLDELRRPKHEWKPSRFGQIEATLSAKHQNDLEESHSARRDRDNNAPGQPPSITTQSATVNGIADEERSDEVQTDEQRYESGIDLRGTEGKHHREETKSTTHLSEDSMNIPVQYYTARCEGWTSPSNPTLNGNGSRISDEAEAHEDEENLTESEKKPVKCSKIQRKQIQHPDRSPRRPKTTSVLHTLGIDNVKFSSWYSSYLWRVKHEEGVP